MPWDFSETRVCKNISASRKQKGDVMGNLGMGELIVVFLIILLLFGANKLPEIGSAIGKAIREFKKVAKEAEGDIKESISDKDHDRKTS